MKKLLIAVTILLILCMSPVVRASQMLIPAPFFAMDDDETFCNSCVIETKECGTSTDKATYQERALTTAHANPIVLGTDGRSQASSTQKPIYFEGCIKYTLKDAADGNTIYSQDNYYGAGASFVGGVNLSDYSGIEAACTALNAAGTDVALYLVGTDTLAGNQTCNDNISIIGTKGGIITTTGFTLTIDGPFSAGKLQSFAGTGDVVFGISPAGGVRPDWFGENTTPGTTDMRLPIQYAIDSIQSVTGDIVYDGIYAVSDSITIYDGINHIGHGYAEIQQDGDNKLLFYGDSINDVTFDNLTLRGGGDGDSGDMLNTKQYSSDSQSRGITIEDTSLPSTPGDVSNITVKNCRLIDFKNYAITIAYPVVAKIINNYITGTDPDPAVYTPNASYQQMGIQIYTPSGYANFPTTEGQVTIEGNTIEKVIHGVYISPGYTDVAINDNVISTTIQHCIYVNGWNNLTINGNVLRPYLSGIKVQISAATYGNPENITISGNTINGGSAGGLTWGIVVDSIRGDAASNTLNYFRTVAVTGNTINDMNTTGGGMYLSNIIDGDATGNIIYNCDETGIRAYEFSGLIASNVINKVKDAGIELRPLPYKEIFFSDNMGIDLSYGVGAGMLTATVAAEPDTWVTATRYEVGIYILADSGTNVYVCTTAGTSGSEPTGTSIAITDGTCVWDFVTTLASMDTGTIAFNRNVFKQRGSRGYWLTATAYQEGSYVDWDGSGTMKPYYCTASHTSAAGTEPGTGASWASYWTTSATFSMYINDTTDTLQIYSQDNIMPLGIKSYLRGDINLLTGNSDAGNSFSAATTSRTATFGKPASDFTSTAAPTSGCYLKGARVWNSAPSTGDYIGWVCIFNYKTTLNGGEPSGEVNMVVTASAGVLDGDVIGVLLDDGTIDWTTVASGQGTTTLVLTVALTDDAATGNQVWMTRWVNWGATQ